LSDWSSDVCSSDLHRLGLGRQPDGEGRSATRYARHRDIAAHQPAEPAADGEAEPGAAELPRGRRVRLRELLEQPAKLFLGHADTCIGDGEVDPPPPGLAYAGHAQAN